jgi:hypothetical protein
VTLLPGTSKTPEVPAVFVHGLQVGTVAHSYAFMSHGEIDAPRRTWGDVADPVTFVALWASNSTVKPKK